MDEEDIEKVKDLEVLLLQPEVRRDASALERLLHRDFREIGASGRCWTRDEIILALAEQSEEVPIAARTLDARHVSTDLILLTYRSDAPHRSALRSSLWARSGTTWQLLFHQGTPVPGSGSE